MAAAEDWEEKNAPAAPTTRPSTAKPDNSAPLRVRLGCGKSAPSVARLMIRGSDIMLICELRILHALPPGPPPRAPPPRNRWRRRGIKNNPLVE